METQNWLDKQEEQSTRTQDADPLLLFQEVEQSGSLNFIGANGWEEIELAVDSGASETVIGQDMAQSATLSEQGPKMGKLYEMADGAKIPNLGEKEFIGVSTEGIQKELKAQVCEISKGLLSVSRVVDAGNRVVFSPKGSYIEDEHGRRMHMEKKRGLYILKLWTKNGSSRDF